MISNYIDRNIDELMHAMENYWAETYTNKERWQGFERQRQMDACEHGWKISNNVKGMNRYKHTQILYVFTTQRQMDAYKHGWMHANNNI